MSVRLTLAHHVTEKGSEMGYRQHIHQHIHEQLAMAQGSPERPRRSRGHRRSHWAGEFGGTPPWEWGGPRGRRAGPRVRRGDVRLAILAVLVDAGDDQLNGYQVIQAIADRTEGAWQPSPGSIYPTIQQLQDEGLVATTGEGRKVLELTPEGRAYTTANAEEMGAVWASFDQSTDVDALDRVKTLKQLMGAVTQVLSNGTATQQEEAMRILGETRRKLYLLLAEEDPESDSEE